MAVSHREVIREAKLKKKRRARKRRIAFWVLLLILLIASVFFIHSSYLAVNKIEVEGLTTEDREKVAEAVKENLSGSYYFLIPKDNTFFVSNEKIALELKEKIPALGEVKVKRADLNTLKIEVGERKTRALWCEPLSLDSIHKPNCFFVDDQAVLYAEAPDFSEGLYLEMIGNLALEPLGKKVMSTGDFSNLYSFSLTLPEFFKTLPQTATNTWKVARIRSLGAGDYAAEMKKEEGEITKVIFNKSQEAWDLATNLNSVFQAEDFQKEFVSGKYLESIDLRFSPKVFYKIK